MKNLKISVLAIAFFLGMTACNRDIERPNFSADEAAEIISNALQNATNGLSEELSDITENVTTTISENFECGVTVDTSFTKNTSSVRVFAEFEVNWEWTPTCNDLDKLIALDYSSAMTGDYTGLRASSHETKASDLTIAGMQLSSALLTYNGTSLIEGTQTVTVQETKQVTSKLTMTLADVTVDKLNTEISAGDVAFSLDVTLDTGEVLNFNGSIEFLGSKDATVIINGETFEIDL